MRRFLVASHVVRIRYPTGGVPLDNGPTDFYAYQIQDREYLSATLIDCSR